MDDVRQLMGASTPHFALQLRNRIAKLIRGLPEGDPARPSAQEIARLERIAFTGEVTRRGGPGRRARTAQRGSGRADAAREGERHRSVSLSGARAASRCARPPDGGRLPRPSRAATSTCSAARSSTADRRRPPLHATASRSSTSAWRPALGWWPEPARARASTTRGSPAPARPRAGRRRSRRLPEAQHARLRDASSARRELVAGLGTPADVLARAAAACRRRRRRIASIGRRDAPAVPRRPFDAAAARRAAHDGRPFAALDEMTRVAGPARRARAADLGCRTRTALALARGTAYARRPRHAVFERGGSGRRLAPSALAAQRRRRRRRRRPSAGARRASRGTPARRGAPRGSRSRRGDCGTVVAGARGLARLSASRRVAAEARIPHSRTQDDLRRGRASRGSSVNPPRGGDGRMPG